MEGAVTETELKYSMNHGCQCMAKQGLGRKRDWPA